MKRLFGGTGKGRILLVLTLFLFIGMLCGGSSWAQEQPQTASLIVKLVPGLSSADQAAVFAVNGGTPVSSIPALRLQVVEVPAAELPTFMQNYQNDPRVERVEENKVRKIEALPTDPLYSTNQWALAKIGWESVFGTVVPT